MGMNPRLLRPRATGFNPKSISGLWAWWDAGDDATITTDTGVSAWADKSGNNRTASQAVGNNQPARNTTINGRSVLTFDGTNDTLDFTGAARTVETMFVVCQMRDEAADTANANRYGCLLGTSGSARGLLLRAQYTVSGGSFQLDAVFSGFTSGTNRIIKTITYLPNNGDCPLAVYAVVRNGASGFEGFINKTSVGTATTSETATLDRIGRSSTSSSYFIGQMAEILIYDKAVLSAERLAITNWLIKRWAITERTYTVS